MFFMIVAIVAFAAGFSAGAGIRKRKRLEAYEQGYHDAIQYSIERIQLKTISLLSSVTVHDVEKN